MDRNTETTYFFKLVTKLNAARRAGDKTGIAEATDDVEMVARHSDNPKLVQRARAALAA